MNARVRRLGPKTLEMDSSFNSEAAAHAFALIFTRRTGSSASYAPLLNPISGEETCWWRVTVPASLMARAEDIRAGFDGVYQEGAFSL